MTKCDECGHDVSDKATSCPNCGNPLKPTSFPVDEPVAAAPQIAPTGSSASDFPAQGGLIGALFGAGAIILGGFLPWVSITSILGTISIAGTDGDGIITLAGGVMIAIVAAIALAKRHASIATTVIVLAASVGVFFVALNIYGNLEGATTLTESLLTNIGVGMWLTLLGALVAFFAGLAVKPNSKGQAGT